jgi:hypothetical protein
VRDGTSIGSVLAVVVGRSSYPFVGVSGWTLHSRHLLLLWLFYWLMGENVYPFVNLDAFVHDFDLVEIKVEASIDCHAQCRKFGPWKDEEEGRDWDAEPRGHCWRSYNKGRKKLGGIRRSSSPRGPSTRWKFSICTRKDTTVA